MLPNTHFDKAIGMFNRVSLPIQTLLHSVGLQKCFWSGKEIFGGFLALSFVEFGFSKSFQISVL